MLYVERDPEVASSHLNYTKQVNKIQQHEISLSDSPLLGNTASNVVSKEYRQFQQTLELVNNRDLINTEDYRKIDKIRYKLLSTTRSALNTYAKKTHRTAACHYEFAPNGKKPTIKYNPKTKSSSWHNTKKCNSELCPVCSVKVGIKVRNRISRIIAEGYKQGYQPVMVTLTVQHDRSHSCDDNVKAMGKAWRKMQQDKTYRQLLKDHGVWGYIRGSDYTFSPINGCHFHFHIVYLVESDCFDEKDWHNDYDDDSLWSQFADIWQYLLGTVKRSCIRDIAVDFRIGDQYIAEYIAKHGTVPRQSRWDITAEMSLKAIKRAPDEHYTLYELMFLAHAGDLWAAKMYAEFCDALHRQKRLVVSQTVRELEAMIEDEPEPEMTDEAVEEAGRRPAFAVPFDAFRVARNHRNMRGTWLRLHEDERYEELQRETAHAQVLGKFQSYVRLKDYKVSDGWHEVKQVNLQGKDDYVEEVVIGHVRVEAGRAQEVTISQDLDSGFYGRLAVIDDD